MSERIAVICLGNLYMKDDGLGMRVAQLLGQRDLGKNISVEEHPDMDLTVIEKLRDASRVIVVDSVKGGKLPGTVSKYSITPRKGDLTELPSLHSLKLSDIIDLAMTTGILSCPVVIIGAEPKDDSPGVGLSPEVESAVSKVVETVIRELS